MLFLFCLLPAWVYLFKRKLHLSAGSEEEAEEVKQTLLKSVGKITDVVSSLGFSWWQRGPPHTQSLKELHWVSVDKSGDSVKNRITMNFDQCMGIKHPSTDLFLYAVICI